MLPEDKPDDTTETSPAIEGEPARETPADPDEDRPDAGKEPDYKRLYLDSKTKIEKANELEREVERLRNERPAPQPAGAAADAQREIDELEAENRELERLAPHDAASRATLRLNRAVISLRQDVLDAFALNRIPEAEQPAVVKLYNTNRDQFGSLSAAAEAYRGRKLPAAQAEIDRLTKELEEAKKGKKPSNGSEDKDDVVRTHGRDTSSVSHKARTMTEADFDAEQKRLKAAGRFSEAREQQGKLRRNEIVLK